MAKRKPAPQIIKTEFELAMVTASILWKGVNISDGAFWVLEQVGKYQQLTHPQDSTSAGVI